MRSSRRTALAALLLILAAINVIILRGMLGTLFFAITVAYVLVPLSSWLRHRGYSRWMAGAISTMAVVLGVLAVVVPLLIVLYTRRTRIFAATGAIPEEVTIEFADISYVVETQGLVRPPREYLTGVAIELVGAAPLLTAKAIVFVFVVFAILIRREELSKALLELLPEAHHEIALRLHERIRQTLFALYITQVATAFGTFLVALPIFVAFDYASPVTLALVAGILQFLPVIGPIVVIFGLVAFELSQGAIVTAAALLLVGLVLIGFLPDAVIRPWLAHRTADIPSSLYFVGFVGGILSLGPVGIIAGPLAVVLLVETVSLLTNEVHYD